MFMLAVTVLAALALSSQSAAVLENSLLAGETADTEGSFFGLSGRFDRRRTRYCLIMKCVKVKHNVYAIYV